MASSNGLHNSMALELFGLATYLNTRDQAAAQSLYDWCMKRNKPYTVKQLKFVQSFIDLAKANKQAKLSAQAAKPKEQPPSFPKLVKLFSQAKKHLAYPKLRFGAPYNFVLTFSPRFFSIAVRQGGAGVGAIDLATGKLAANFMPPPNIVAQLVEIEKDPVAIATVEGRQVGQCMFCGHALTDERSIVHGYGPICADSWGLPWEAERKGETSVSLKASSLKASEL